MGPLDGLKGSAARLVKVNKQVFEHLDVVFPAHRELLPAIDAVLAGKRFVSGALERVSDEPRFDIFAGLPEKDAMWLEAVMGLEKARNRMEMLAFEIPGRYFVLSMYRHTVLAQIDTSQNVVQDDLLPKRKLGAA